LPALRGRRAAVSEQARALEGGIATLGGAKPQELAEESVPKLGRNPGAALEQQAHSECEMLCAGAQDTFVASETDVRGALPRARPQSPPT
jgi:hypothetical protein